MSRKRMEVMTLKSRRKTIGTLRMERRTERRVVLALVRRRLQLLRLRFEPGSSNTTSHYDLGVHGKK
jgi:hypothetical protein